MKRTIAATKRSSAKRSKGSPVWKLVKAKDRAVLDDVLAKLDEDSTLLAADFVPQLVQALRQRLALRSQHELNGKTPQHLWCYAMSALLGRADFAQRFALADLPETLCAHCPARWQGLPSLWRDVLAAGLLQPSLLARLQPSEAWRANLWRLLADAAEVGAPCRRTSFSPEELALAAPLGALKHFAPRPFRSLVPAAPSSHLAALAAAPSRAHWLLCRAERPLDAYFRPNDFCATDTLQHWYHMDSMFPSLVNDSFDATTQQWVPHWLSQRAARPLPGCLRRGDNPAWLFAQLEHAVLDVFNESQVPEVGQLRAATLAKHAELVPHSAWDGAELWAALQRGDASAALRLLDALIVTANQHYARAERVDLVFSLGWRHSDWNLRRRATASLHFLLTYFCLALGCDTPILEALTLCPSFSHNARLAPLPQPLAE
jgi:hypothetical protein